jgi:hypothetical protein
MEYYVGLDVSLKQTSICVVDRTGSVVREGVVDSDPEAISAYVRSIVDELKIHGVHGGLKQRLYRWDSQLIQQS